MKMIVKLIIIELFVICAVTVRSADGYGWTKESLLNNFKEIHSKTSPGVQRKSAIQLIARLLPNHWHLFDVKINSSLPINTFKLLKKENEPNLQIIASNGVSACKGFYYYFQHELGGHVSWSGNHIPEIPKNLPPINYSSQSASQFIYHQNVCTWSYSYAWWTWEEWQKHIDWMALMGISLTIAPVQEAVWTRVYKKLGLTDNEINDHFAGVAFQAWQRMGNIRGWSGPLSDRYKNEQLALQQQIIQAERNLGMTVALPAFAGHVPIAFRRLFPNITLTPVECWNHFPADYCCPLFIDPEEETFQEVGRIFLREVIQEYGTDHIYFSDPFNEIQPSEADPEYLGQASMNIYEAMKQIDSQAIWLLQGWMFVKNPFWNNSLIKAFLTAVPTGRMLVLDLQSEIYPQYERTESYFGQPFIWCMLHNFGGTLGMQGSMEIVNYRIGLTRNMENSTMVGVGITMEGIHQNDIMYAFALDRGWELYDLKEEDWMDQFSKTRYGLNASGINMANHYLRESVYSYRGLEKLHGKYTIVIRPSIKWKPWTWYDPKAIETVCALYLPVADRLKNSSLYQHDLIDLMRQFLQNKADEIFVNLIHQYNAKNLTAINQLSVNMKELFIDLDGILKTSSKYLLGTWLRAAKNMAETELEKLIYEHNARNQITTWGPKAQINDYANKQWAGMILDYYWPRWQMFLKDMEIAVKFGRNFNEKQFKAKVFRDIESPFTYDRKVYSNEAQGSTIIVAQAIYDKWTMHRSKDYLSEKVPIKNQF